MLKHDNTGLMLIVLFIFSDKYGIMNDENLMNKASCRIRRFILSYYKMHINLNSCMSCSLMNNFKSALLRWSKKTVIEIDYDSAKRP